MKRVGWFVVVGIAALVLSGCNRSPAHVSQQTLESNPAALAAAMKACSPDAKDGAPPSSSDCQHVGYAAYVVRSQYAGGMLGVGISITAIMEYYDT